MNTTIAQEQASDPPQPSCREEIVAGFGLVTVITGFQPGTDRLLLDFHNGATLPELSFDMGLEPGSTAVMGNGLLMVMLRAAQGVTTGDVDLRVLPEPELWDQPAPLDFVESFDPELDVVEVVYQPDHYDRLAVEVVDFADGTGATIWFNDDPILAVRGAQGLAPEDVVLTPR